MIAKMAEVRDRGTCVPMLVVKLDSEDGQEAWLLRRAGFHGADPLVLLCKVSGGSGHYACTADPFDWGSRDRTYSSTHRWLAQHFDEVEPGQVVDVEVVLGEKVEPKVSERWE